MIAVKLVVQVKLLPTPEQAPALEATLRACNTAASEVAGIARDLDCYRDYGLRRHTYDEIKADHGLGAQAAQHVIKKVCDAYRTLKTNLRNGRYGKPGSKRRHRVETNPIAFRPGSSASTWASPTSPTTPTATGTPGPSSTATDAARPGCGNACKPRAPSPPSGCWPRRRKKEARHAANINHVIAKTIVTEAARTGRGIAVEDLTGIRDRVRLRKPQRVTLCSWSFHQLGEHLAYKARRAGVPLVEVDPRYTSQTCYRCGHRDQRNRPDQETFTCRSCWVVAHADHNAALNIASRGVEGWAAVNPPHVA